MTVRIMYDKNALIGDILSKEGNYIDLLSCNEYTLWYLIRQEGVRGFLPALHTKAFLAADSIESVTGFDMYTDYNIRVILDNLKQFYGMDTVMYQGEESLYHFIAGAVKSNHFVYTKYDHYYDTLGGGQGGKHDYHGHPVTGFDDGKELYYSFFDEDHMVRFDDMEQMARHCTEIDGTCENRFFFLNKNSNTIPAFHDKNLIYMDCIKTLNDWKREIQLFTEYLFPMQKIKQSDRMEIAKFALKERLFFNSITEGLHFNFALKLYLLRDYFQIPVDIFLDEFLKNRKKSIIIANMFRKIVILSEKDNDSLSTRLEKIAGKIQEYFITESSSLCIRFEKILEEVGKKIGS